jgi:peptide subunit release factor 1 (eRF1)
MTGDEMQRAIEFLLRNQANFETHFEESNSQWKGRLERSNRRFDMHAEETNRQIARTSQVVEALAETQSGFTQTVLRFISLQSESNASVQQTFDALANAQQRTQQEISELTKIVNTLIQFSTGSRNSPPD